ncbi:hypothetical protein IMSAGC015_01969 [Lachnospiraceae bacterium]|nr:hypothetical protein IMSAGC015_01969 [Lachnospiraceae bacterium]
MTAGFNLKELLHKPEGLTCLIEARRSLCRNTAAVLCDLKEFCLSLCITALSGLLLCKLCVPAGICDCRLAADDHCLQKMGTFHIIPVSHAAFCKLCLRFFYDSFVTHFQHLFILDGHMAYAIIKVIARCKNIVVDRPDRLRRHIGRRKLACSLTFPVLMDLPEILLGLLRYVERISASCLHRLEFRLQPFIREFRICLASPRCNRRAADDKFHVADNDRYVFQNMLKCFGTSYDHRLTLCGLIRLCDQNCPCRFNLRHLCKQVIHQPADPVRLWNTFTVISIKSHVSPFLPYTRPTKYTRFVCRKYSICIT